MFKNTIISFLVIGSTLASAAPIKWNNIPVPDYSSSNQAYSQGNQQVQQGLQQMADALSNFGRQEQRTYTRVGDHSYGSDGSSYYHSNGNTYGSNGVNTYSINDNSGYLMCAELAGDFHLGDSRQLTDKSLLPFDLVS